MPKLHPAIALAATLTLLGGCETVPVVYKYPEPPKGSKEAEIEMMQKAAALAVGNQAWEPIEISNIQRDATSLKWVAKTRSRDMTCTADPDGSNAYCDSVDASNTPAGQ
jgi:hypothetical protein